MTKDPLLISAERREASGALLLAALSVDLEAGADREPDEQPVPPGTQFGEYVLEREIGRGAFGEVYLARQVGSRREVALKRMRRRNAPTDEEVARFLEGAEAAAELDHPNIVPVLHVGKHAGQPFFTMRYVNGRNLGEELERRRPTLREATTWLSRIARAVQHAHERGIIHCDLKPENILMDESGVPYVADFGIARRLDRTTRSSPLDAVAGAPFYMAPEQLSLRPEVTVRTDVFGLGVIYCHLLTGEVPHGRLSSREWERALLRPEPIVLPESAASLHPDLRAVCYKALAKSPEERYQSARELAVDLDCLLANETPWCRRTGSLLERIAAALRSHRSAFGRAAFALALAAVAALWLMGVYESEQESVAREEQENAAMASVQAVAFRFQMLEYAHRISRMARQPEIRELLVSPKVESPSQELLDRARGFGSLFVMGRDGVQRARTTKMPGEYLRRSFEFRDYFRGARSLAEKECTTQGTSGPAALELGSAYIGRTHVSESDGVFEFAISAPVCDRGQWLGVVSGTIPSSQAFGDVRLADSRAHRIAALLAPRDIERADVGRSLPRGLTFVAHPGLPPGQEFQLPAVHVETIAREFGGEQARGKLRYVKPLHLPDYRDPVPGYGGVWSAAIAPVDESGFMVVVQTPSGRARPRTAVLSRLPWVAGIWTVVALGLALFPRLGKRRRAL